MNVLFRCYKSDKVQIWNAKNSVPFDVDNPRHTFHQVLAKNHKLTAPKMAEISSQ
jgi:hypothetical protein